MKDLVALVQELATLHNAAHFGGGEMEEEDVFYGVEKTVPSEWKSVVAAIGEEDLELWREPDHRMGSWHLYGGQSMEVNGEDSIWGCVSPLCIGQSMGSIGSGDILWLDADGTLGEAGAVYVTSFEEGSVLLAPDSEYPDYRVAKLAPSASAFLEALVALGPTQRGRSGEDLRRALTKS